VLLNKEVDTLLSASNQAFFAAVVTRKYN